MADEPVSALDVSVQAQILNLMRKLQRQYSLSYLFISHDLSVIRYMADTIGVMYFGKLVEVGAAEDICTSPAHPYTAGLIEAVPVVTGQPHGRRTLAPLATLPARAQPLSGCRFRGRCAFAQDICAEKEPPLRPRPATGQLVACHFPLGPPRRICRPARRFRALPETGAACSAVGAQLAIRVPSACAFGLASGPSAGHGAMPHGPRGKGAIVGQLLLPPFLHSPMPLAFLCLQ